MHKHLSNLLKIAVTVLGLALVLLQVDLQQIRQTLFAAELGWLLVGFLLINLSLVIRAYRWLRLLRGLGLSVPFKRLVALYFVGNFFNIALPSGLGGDVVRVVEITRDVPGNVATGTVLLDRLTGLIMLFVMALLVLPWRPNSFPPPLLWLIVVGSVAGIGGSFVLLEGRVGRRFGRWLPAPLSPVGDGLVARLLEAVQGCGWRAVWEALAVSVLFNLILAAWWVIVGRSLGQAIPFSYAVIIMPILSLPLLIPSISGLGPRELLAPALFVVVGISAETAVAISLLIFVITRLSGLLGAPVYIASLLRGSQVKRQRMGETAEST